MKRVTLAGLLVLAATIAAVAVAARVPDGAVIRNSGSTNTPGYTIKVWSDGRGEVLGAAGGRGKAFTLDSAVAAAFFRDAQAGRADPGTPSHCMKSASFGTTTTVLWHGWRSPDLQCPPFTAAVQALAAEVNAVQSAAQISVGPRRVPLPREPRMIPGASPEVSPT